MSLAPIVAIATTDTELRDAADRYNLMLAKLHSLEAAIASDRARRDRPRGLFSGPGPTISTEARELRALELTEQLHRERSRIASHCQTWDRLGPGSTGQGAT